MGQDHTAFKAKLAFYRHKCGHSWFIEKNSEKASGKKRNCPSDRMIYNQRNRRNYGIFPSFSQFLNVVSQQGKDIVQGMRQIKFCLFKQGGMPVLVQCNVVL